MPGNSGHFILGYTYQQYKYAVLRAVSSPESVTIGAASGARRPHRDSVAAVWNVLHKQRAVCLKGVRVMRGLSNALPFAQRCATEQASHTRQATVMEWAQHNGAHSMTETACMMNDLTPITKS